MMVHLLIKLILLAVVVIGAAEHKERLFKAQELQNLKGSIPDGLDVYESQLSVTGGDFYRAYFVSFLYECIDAMDFTRLRNSVIKDLSIVVQDESVDKAVALQRKEMLSFLKLVADRMETFAIDESKAEVDSIWEFVVSRLNDEGSPLNEYVSMTTEMLVGIHTKAKYGEDLAVEILSTASILELTSICLEIFHMDATLITDAIQREFRTENSNPQRLSVHLRVLPDDKIAILIPKFKYQMKSLFYSNEDTPGFNRELLIAEVAHKSGSQATWMQQLELEGFGSIGIMRGDGSCFYRSLFLSFIENCILQNDKEALNVVSKKLSWFLDNPRVRPLYTSQISKVITMLEQVADNLTLIKWKEVKDLAQDATSDFDHNLIVAGRFLVAKQIEDSKDDPEIQEVVVALYGSWKSYLEKVFFRYKESIEGVALRLSAPAFGIHFEIVGMVGAFKNGFPVIDTYHYAGHVNEHASPSAFVRFNGDHYDMLSLAQGLDARELRELRDFTAWVAPFADVHTQQFEPPLLLETENQMIAIKSGKSWTQVVAQILKRYTLSDPDDAPSR